MRWVPDDYTNGSVFATLRACHAWTYGQVTRVVTDISIGILFALVLPSANSDHQIRQLPHSSCDFYASILLPLPSLMQGVYCLVISATRCCTVAAVFVLVSEKLLHVWLSIKN